MTQGDENYLDTNEAAKFLDVSPKTLRNWRHAGKGPAYHKLHRTIRYLVRDLREWQRREVRRIDPRTGQSDPRDAHRASTGPLR